MAAIKGANRDVAGFYCAIWSIAEGELLEKAPDKPYSPVSQLSWRSCAQHLPQDETDIERTDVDQQTLQNIVSSAQGATPHSTLL